MTTAASTFPVQSSRRIAGTQWHGALIANKIYRGWGLLQGEAISSQQAGTITAQDVYFEALMQRPVVGLLKTRLEEVEAHPIPNAGPPSLGHWRSHRSSTDSGQGDQAAVRMRSVAYWL